MLNITEVRVKLMRNRSDRLRAFCSITIDDDFVVHDLRVIEGRKGFFVAMPSRKLTDNCPECGSKNELRAHYCSRCGHRLDENRATSGPDARDKFHVDVAHPINTPCREMLQRTVLAAYEAERERVEQGLPPQREYEAEGLEELAEDYADTDEELGEEQGETEEETSAEAETPPSEAEQVPAPEEEAEEAEPAPEPGAPSEERLEVPPLPREEEPPTGETEEEEDEEEAGKPDLGEFGAGIF
ncbi:MAG: SpoVG family protein [Candidatus Brocadiaceae bacterium]